MGVFNLMLFYCYDVSIYKIYISELFAAPLS